MFSAPGYETDHKLYESDNSIIYRAIRAEDRQPVILKVLKALQPPPEVIARFEREYLLTRDLALPGVIEAYGHFQTENHWVLVTEDFGADSLRRLQLAGQIAVDRFLQLAIEITDIVAAVHQAQVIHKDINPSNLVLNPQTRVVKLIDFGISSRRLSQETVTFEHPTRLEGTPGYLSPEQTGRINRPLDHRTDFYSLGCTFYELLTARLPFDSDDLLELVHCHLARTPIPPREVRPQIPLSLSQLICKLLAKNPDDRYQSGHGLKVDLLACQEMLRRPSSDTATFDLGRGDATTRFHLPARLYGRDAEIAQLLQAFDRVGGGDTGLMLVCGYSGIGKSALVRELYEPITARRGFFVSGKFEQYERNIPYAPVLEAFQALIQQLLCESEDRIARWRDTLLDAVGPSCAVLVKVIPTLELVTGPLPPAPSLPPGEAHFRFTLAIRELVRAFARPEHPLVIFLDDLQWSDSASLEFIESLTTSDRVPHLFIIGAYRDNEVGPTHPLALMLQDIELAETLRLQPIGLPDVIAMLADTFRVSASEASALAGLVHEKTGGNPFFVCEFLKALHADELIAFQHATGRWEWSIDRIRTRDISDNVVELLTAELHKLPPATQSRLHWAACLGSRFDLRTLQALGDDPVEQITDELLPAISEGFILPLSADYRLFEANVPDLEQRVEVSYKFAHDRIQQAAYTSIPQADRTPMHLHIGRRLRHHAPADLLEIVNQLDIASALIEDPQERLAAARLNLRAGDKARESAANESALGFFREGLRFLAPPASGEGDAIVCADADAYARDYALSLRLTESAAEAAYLSADFAAMERLTDSGLAHARSWEDKVALYQIKVNAATAQNKLLGALDLAGEILEPLGVSLPKEPTQAHIDEAIAQVDQAMGERSIGSMVDLPPADPDAAGSRALRILDSISFTTIMAKQQLGPIVAAEMIKLTLENGRTEESINGYTFYGIQLCGQDRIDQGYEFGLLARAACAREQSKAQLSELSSNGYYQIFHLKEPIRDLIEDIKRGYQAGWDTGRIAGAFNCLVNTTMAPFIAGFALGDLDEQMRKIVEAAEQYGQDTYVMWLRVYWQCVLNFIHEYDDPCVLQGDAYDEHESLEVHRRNHDDLTIQLVYIIKVMLCCRFGRYQEAADFFGRHVQGKYPKSGVLLPPTTMYYCVAQLALYPAAGEDERARILADVRREHAQMEVWARHCAANYGHKYHLVAAELSRALAHGGKGDDEARAHYRRAHEHYDLAIDLARANLYLNEESFALERAVSFFRDHGRDRLAAYYLRDALYAYERWGAHAKLEELKQRYPDLIERREPPAKRSRATAGRPAGGEGSAPTGGKTLTTGELPDLDLETVLRASRAISAEHDQAGLLERIMSICLTHAGARRGFLILVRDDELVVKARGVLDQDTEVELLSRALEEQEGLAHSIVHYVHNSAAPVRLDDAAAEDPYKSDPHIRANACRSVLCIPIVYQGTLVGICYMENNQTPGAFKEDRLEVLSLLMAQAAVSIENAWLRSADDDDGFKFTVGGSLAGDTPSYVLRRADRELTQRIRSGDFCFVFNVRQMGKSSLRIHTMDQLVGDGVRCAAIDITSIGSDNLTAEQWYAGLARAMISGLGLRRQFKLRRWWKEHEHLSPAQRLGDLIDEVVLDLIGDPIVIFVDEIDMVLGLDFSLDDFFGLIRSFYNKRPDDPRYRRLSFVLLGVATPTDLIQDKMRTPFNIGHAISMTGFRFEEARTLTRGLTGIDERDLVLKEILRWTGGQPFLSQKLCKIAQQAETRPTPSKEPEWVEGLVRRQIIDEWRIRDEPQHLKTIEARVLRSPNKQPLLALYREILGRGGVVPTEAPLESELMLSGLVVRRQGKLRVGNPIYAWVFDDAWIAGGME